jgi:hypothetical protein
MALQSFAVVQAKKFSGDFAIEIFTCPPIGGTDSFNEFRGPTPSQTGRGDHAIANIRVDTGHQKCADRAEMPVLFLDRCAIGVAFAEFSCCEHPDPSVLINNAGIMQSDPAALAGRRQAVLGRQVLPDLLFIGNEAIALGLLGGRR